MKLPLKHLAILCKIKGSHHTKNNLICLIFHTSWTPAPPSPRYWKKKKKNSAFFLLALLASMDFETHHNLKLDTHLWIDIFLLPWLISQGWGFYGVGEKMFYLIFFIFQSILIMVLNLLFVWKNSLYLFMMASLIIAILC